MNGCSRNAKWAKTIECIDPSNINAKITNPAMPVTIGIIFALYFLQKIINNTIGTAIEISADIAIKAIEKTETCIVLPPNYFYHVLIFISILCESI
jgi:hypothetical protein